MTNRESYAGQERQPTAAGEPAPQARVSVEARAVCERLGISHETLEHLRARFAEGLPRELADLVAAASSGDGEAIRQRAHGLSGAAGSLGIDRLRRAAATLESAGRAGGGPFATLLAAVEAEARAALDSIAPEPAAPQPATGPPPSPERLLALSRLLAGGDRSGVIALLSTLDQCGGAQLAQLRVLIGDYQYERAAALIEESK